jgi:outer membrane protein assembly factor BamB
MFAKTAISMKPRFCIACVAALVFTQVTHAANSPTEAQQFWPQWRGPLATGVAPLADPPMEWSETKNVKWKVKVPGFGTSTPIIWGDRVFIVTAVSNPNKVEAKPSEAVAASTDSPNPGVGRRRPGGGFRRSEKPTEAYQFTVLCLDRRTGKALWQKVVREEVPHEGHHQDHGFASASPVTDGKHLVAYFGSRGLYGLDVEGNLKWEKDFGDMQTKNSFGEGSSPALSGNTVVVLWDHDGDDFIVALDKATGKELWRTPRNDDTGWSTPLVIENHGKPQVVVNATRKVRSYDLATGKQIWECAGQTANAIPSPVATADTVYVTSGFRGSALFAFRLDRTGDLAGTDAIRWSHNGNTPYVPSPLLMDDALYLVTGNNGTLSCFDAKSGKASFEGERLDGVFGIYASPVAAKDRVYVLGRAGTCLVLKNGPKLEVLATNKLDDKTDASLALAGSELFVRGHQNLYCIAEK